MFVEDTIMRINIDRLSKLAGLPVNNRSGRTLREGKEEMEAEGMRGMREEEDMNEMIEVDEAMLVQELRRAKKIMQENKRRKIMAESRKRNRKQRMFEAQLREMIDQEVANVFDEMQITGEWVYGRNKPTRSRKGYTHQGSFIPGVGFKR
jgi:hypothetical protein